MFNDYVMGLVEHSNKMLLFFKILEETIKVGERVLLFSQSLLTLDLMETFLHERTVPSKKSFLYFLQSVNFEAFHFKVFFYKEIIS